MKNRHKRGRVRAKIFFHDECRNFKCGWRHVEIKYGPKWVYLTDVANGRRQRLMTAVVARAMPFIAEHIPGMG